MKIPSFSEKPALTDHPSDRFGNFIPYAGHCDRLLFTRTVCPDFSTAFVWKPGLWNPYAEDGQQRCRPCQVCTVFFENAFLSNRLLPRFAVTNDTFFNRLLGKKPGTVKSFCKSDRRFQRTRFRSVHGHAAP